VPGDRDYAERVFRRRTTAPETASPAAPDRPGAKGRPTPRRREAEQRRKEQLRAPRDRRSAAKQQRELARAERLKQREALISGDERHLPPRDRGPVRRLARNVVDSRLTAAEFFLPLAILIFLSGLVPIPEVIVGGQLLFLVLIAVIVVDTSLLIRTLKRTIAKRYPNESTRGVTFYAIMRAMQIRRLRLPKPQVKRGQAY
jgi:Protein of unknown function (DUF3043)